MSDCLMKMCNVMTWKEWSDQSRAKKEKYRSLNNYYYYLIHSIYRAMVNFPEEAVLSLIDEIKDKYKGFVEIAEDLYPYEKPATLFLKGKLNRAYTEYTKLYFGAMDIVSLCDQLLVFVHQAPGKEGPKDKAERHQFRQIKKMLKIIFDSTDKFEERFFGYDRSEEFFFGYLDEHDIMQRISEVLVLKITIAILKDKYDLGDARSDMQEIYDFMIEMYKGTNHGINYELSTLTVCMHIVESYCEMSQYYILNLDLLFERLLSYFSGNEIIEIIMTPNPFFQQVSSIKPPLKIYSSYIEECDRILSSEASEAVKRIAQKLKPKISQREKKDLEFPRGIPRPIIM
ncbi:MAG: hypothetical protein WC327_04485 [Candidatus Cloacimonadia bacterium]